MKAFALLIGLCIVALGLMPSARDQTKAEPATSTEATCDQALLSAVGSLLPMPSYC